MNERSTKFTIRVELYVIKLWSCDLKQNPIPNVTFLIFHCLHPSDLIKHCNSLPKMLISKKMPLKPYNTNTETPKVDHLATE